MKQTLTLRPRPAKMVQKESPPVPADPQKIALSERLSLRFISRQGRYILQTHAVIYSVIHSQTEHTWVDIPLVPEVYG